MRIGYVLKRFPRASETFIAQEILALERLGVEVVILALRSNDQAVEHEGLVQIEAPVYTFEPQSFSRCWRALQQQAHTGDKERTSIHRALLAAFDHPKRSGKRYLVESWWIAKLSRDLGLHHLHAHFANHPAFVAMVSHLISGTSYSFTAHAKDIYLDGPGPELWRRQFDSADFVVTVSRSNRSYLDALLAGPTNGKLHTIYNGVDLDRIHPDGQRREDASREVVFASRLIEKKGADLLIEAAAQVVRSDPRTRFTVIGDGEERPNLENLAAELGLGRWIRFTGMLPHQEVVRRVRSSDLFVLPCRIADNGDRDALPTVLVEAMAAGIACVSTPINGVPEIIDQGRTGLIVPENDPASLAAAIDQLLADPRGRRIMGRAGRQKAEREFDLRSSAIRLRGLFESAMRGGRVEAVSPSKTAAVP